MSKQSVRIIFFTILVIAVLGILKNVLGKTDNKLLREAVKKDPFLVDVRTTAEFDSGTVAGAINIPLDKLPQQLEKFTGKETIVVFCRSGNRSGKAKDILEQKGFRNIVNGGSWQNVKKVIDEQQQ